MDRLSIHGDTLEKRNMMMAAIVAFVVIVSIVGTYNYTQRDSDKATVTLIIDFNGFGENVTYENVKMPESSTVLDLLNNKTDLQTEDTSFGKMVVSINDVAQDADSNLWWTYTINDEYAAAGAEVQLLNDGDIIKWTLSQF